MPFLDEPGAWASQLQRVTLGTGTFTRDYGIRTYNNNIGFEPRNFFPLEGKVLYFKPNVVGNTMASGEFNFHIRKNNNNIYTETYDPAETGSRPVKLDITFLQHDVGEIRIEKTDTGGQIIFDYLTAGKL